MGWGELCPPPSFLQLHSCFQLEVVIYCRYQGSCGPWGSWHHPIQVLYMISPKEPNSYRRWWSQNDDFSQNFCSSLPWWKQPDKTQSLNSIKDCERDQQKPGNSKVTFPWAVMGFFFSTAVWACCLNFWISWLLLPDVTDLNGRSSQVGFGYTLWDFSGRSVILCSVK